MDDITDSSLPFQTASSLHPARPVNKNMNAANDRHTTAPASGISLGDIYYALFRHKWKILLCTLAGVGAAAVFYKLNPPPYFSEAKLFVRYVDVGQPLNGPGDTTKTVSPDTRGGAIMNSEVEILTSLNIARDAAQTVGPEKILAHLGGGQDLQKAAAIVHNGLTVTVPKDTNVIDAVFNSTDPTIVQPVLSALIAAYLKRHVEVHESIGMLGDYLAQETDQLRSRLVQTEEDLKKARDKAGVISVQDARAQYAAQLTQLQTAIFTAQADLAERTVALQHLMGDSATAAPAPAGGQKPVPPAKVEAYREASMLLATLQQKKQGLLSQFTASSPMVTSLQARINQVEAQKRQLEKDYPALTQTVVAAPAAGSQGSGGINLQAEASQIAALKAKVAVLEAQQKQVQTQADRLDQLEVTIEDLRRKQELEAANYKYYAASLEQSRINDALGNGRVSNISQIQTPSPPAREISKLTKVLAMLLVGGVGLGLAWAFSIEMYFDRSIRRPVYVERKVGVPLFLSIPDAGRLGQRRQLRAARKSMRKLALAQNSTARAKRRPRRSEELIPWNPDGVLNPFYETLRDRLVGFFESTNVTHRPKLVAVTGLGKNSGITTIAAGLAASYSRTGEGNVLLVDMTAEQGSAQQFYRGKAVCGLDEALDKEGNAQVQDKLYVVSEEPNGHQLSHALPRRFSQLVPKLMASDFDVIIFDMPPVSQISITPRVASFMDMVLMVIESEKNHEDVVRRATALLAESKAPVGAVLNKTRTYVPPKLHQETLSDL